MALGLVFEDVSIPQVAEVVTERPPIADQQLPPEAKSGNYTYYVCHSLLKRSSGTCKTPRLNAKTFEKLIVDEIRANILTKSNIRDLVKLLDEPAMYKELNHECQKGAAELNL